MRYVSLALIAIGALMFPFAAMRGLTGLSAQDWHDVKIAIAMLVIGLVLIGTGVVLSKRDDTSSAWRKKSGSKRIRLR